MAPSWVPEISGSYYEPKKADHDFDNLPHQRPTTGPNGEFKNTRHGAAIIHGGDGSLRQTKMIDNAIFRSTRGSLWHKCRTVLLEIIQASRSGVGFRV